MAEKVKEKNIHQGHRKRLKQRFLDEGLDHFHEVNVLELMLFYCVQRKDTNPLAHRLLDHFGKLPNVLDATVQDLMRVEGVTEHTAIYLTMIAAVYRYNAAIQPEELTELRTPEECIKFLVPLFAGARHEKLFVVCLDGRCRILCCKLLSEGKPASVQTVPRKVVDLATRYHATSVLMAHNHSDGLVNPSAADIASTESIRTLLKIVGINLVEHYVVCEQSCLPVPRPGNESKFLAAVKMDENFDMPGQSKWDVI